MALRILQFGIVFAIGYYLGPASPSAGAADVPEEPIIPVSIQLNDPEDVTVRRGQTAILRCDAKSSKNLKISWFHNDILIPSNDSRRFVRGDGSLQILKIGGGKKNKGLTGEYRCKADAPNMSLLSNPVKLKIASFGEFTEQPTNLSVPESQPAVLFCDIHSVPTADIQWEFNTEPLPQNTRYVPLPSGALLITKTHSSDAGSYRCIATNTLLNKTKDSKILELTVSSSLMETVAPTFLPLNILPNATVLVGGNTNLYCAVTGWPIPTVQWHNNKNIVINNSSVLQFRNITLQDAGNYTCIAYNSGGRNIQVFTLEVQQEPYFNVTPTSRIYPPAKTVRFDCQAKGVPRPKIYWLKNGEPLPNEARIKRQWTGLVFSHTFTSDLGIYQCIAVNPAGRIRTAAELVFAFSDTPSPPENVQCRAFDETSICLTWNPPRNVNVTAYSIYCYYTAMGKQISGPENLTNKTQQLATNLKVSTNYTFYIRLYSKMASDPSQKVTCQTGIQGHRNLQVIPINETSVELSWSKVSTDIPCDGTKPSYKIQWKRKGRTAISSDNTEAFSHAVSGLTPSAEYDFRVIPFWNKNDNSNWFTFGPQGDGRSRLASNSTDLPLPPEKLQVNRIDTTSVNLSWIDTNENTGFYTVCVTQDIDDSNCKEGELFQSVANTLPINNLNPNTSYEFKVRAHNFDGNYGPFSEAISIRTQPRVLVPSKVLNLSYEVANKTAVCLHWQAPLHTNGKLTKYLILYTPNSDWPLDDWFNKSVPTTKSKSKGCWSRPNDDQTLSTLLLDLNPEHTYTVYVRAASEIGLGDPIYPIKITTNDYKSIGPPEQQENEEDNDVQYNQKLGVIMGVTLSIACVIFCISCILVRKKCLKSRSFNRAGTASSSNYYPAVAHYASEGSSVQVRLENPCSAEIHEIEHLVNEDSATHIPTVTPAHLDTKGTDGFPNGHINGSFKPYLNGHVKNGMVHITENPRYCVFGSNGNIEKKSKPPQIMCSSPYEEDSNSNLKTSKFHDLHHLFENSKFNKSRPCNYSLKKSKPVENSISNPSASSSEDSLNSTQLTCLDNSFMMHHRRVSPILGPNG